MNANPGPSWTPVPAEEPRVPLKPVNRVPRGEKRRVGRLLSRGVVTKLQRVHVTVWSISGPLKSSYSLTLGSICVLWSYLDLSGMCSLL